MIWIVRNGLKVDLNRNSSYWNRILLYKGVTMMGLIEELTSVRVELVDRIHSLSDEQLNKKPDDDTWSIVQVVRHLLFIDEFMYPALLKAMQRDAKLVEEKSIDFVKDRSRKLKSPYPEPSTDFISKEDMLKAVQTSREPLIDFLHSVSEHELMKKTMMHPLLGVMQSKQVLEFVALHEKRHIEQIEELIKRP